MKATTTLGLIVWLSSCALWLSCSEELSHPAKMDRDDDAVRTEHDMEPGEGGSGGTDDSGLAGDGGTRGQDQGGCDDDALEAEGTRLEVAGLFSAFCTGDLPMTERQFDVLRDGDSFRAALLQSAWHQGPRREGEALPAVDFDNEVVLAAFGGQLPHCGIEFHISAAYEQEEQVEIIVTLGSLCYGDDARTFPYAFARAPKLNKPYVFTLREKDCCNRQQDAPLP